MPQRLVPPLEPMLAKTVATIPAGMAYEPTWDGFRCLIFRNHDDVQLWSRHGKDRSRFFPELVTIILDNTPPRCVLDGEIVVVVNDRLDFGKLSERIHPAASRIEQLSEDFPASFIAWDVLGLDSTDLTSKPFQARRKLLERALAHAEAPFHLSPQTLNLTVAKRWFHEFQGVGLHGIIAKPLDQPYSCGTRTMFKIKHKREADVVVAGYTLHKNSTSEQPLLGALQLGLYENDVLRWVGVSAAFSATTRAELAARFAATTLIPGSETWLAHPWATPQAKTAAQHPDVVNRWTKTIKDYHLLDPMLVATVTYQHMEGQHFRNSTSFVCWRPDREPDSCGFDQLEVPSAMSLSEMLAL